MNKKILQFIAAITLILSLSVFALPKNTSAAPGECFLFSIFVGNGTMGCESPQLLAIFQDQGILPGENCYAIAFGSELTPEQVVSVTQVECELEVVAAPTTSLEAPDGSTVDRNAVANCDGSGSEAALQACLEANPLINIIKWVINILAAGVGVITVLMIVIGGIQYSTSGANPQAVGAAKGRIANAIIALIMFAFIYAFLQWLVPGGIF